MYTARQICKRTKYTKSLTTQTEKLVRLQSRYASTVWKVLSPELRLLLHQSVD